MKIKIVPAQEADYLSTPEIAARFGVTRLTVLNWIHGGKLEALRIGGRWKVTPEAIDRFIHQTPEWGVTAQKLRAAKKVGRPPKPRPEVKPGPKYDRRKYKFDK